MNRKFTHIIKNFSYTIFSNFISLLITALVTLIVPKLIGVEEFGFWQLYIFYSAYVVFLSFGWYDGIYLRYGGKEYKEIDKELFFSQFYMFVFFQLLIFLIIMLVSNFLISDENRLFIFKMTLICMLIVNVKYMLQYILQGTNRIKEYARTIMIDRIFYLCLSILLLLFGIREYKLLIIADLTGRFISLLYAMFSCKEIVFNRISTFFFSFKEAKANINVGIKLMFANIASMLIIGVVRFEIERTWGVVAFGKVSLALSVSNILIVFVNAIGLVMFPILRRTDENKLPSIYCIMRDFLMLVLFGILLIYYPFKVVLTAWLPKYADSLKYMAIIFPVCIYEGKMSLLNNTYLKTLRQEKHILKVNLITLSLSIVFTFISTHLLNELDFAVMSIVILLSFKCILSEAILSKLLHVAIKKDIFLELIMTTLFILTGWYINSWFTVLIYGMAYIIYLFIKREDLKNTVCNFKILVRI